MLRVDRERVDWAEDDPSGPKRAWRRGAGKSDQKRTG
jgi:hypothetical protein